MIPNLSHLASYSVSASLKGDAGGQVLETILISNYIHDMHSNTRGGVILELVEAVVGILSSRSPILGYAANFWLARATEGPISKLLYIN